MIRTILLSLVPAVLAAASNSSSALEMARAIRDTGLDPDECYRVRDLAFAKEDLRLYFNDGYLLFGKPAFGKRLWAVYSGEVEGGDAEVIVMPPHRSERRSLASFSGSPNLNEHFRSGFFISTDGSADSLLAQAREIGRKSPEQGILLTESFTQVSRSLSESFAMRLVQDILNAERPEAGLFFGTLGSTGKGNIDIMYDASSREQIIVGQVANKEGRPSFDVWCSFESRSVRNGARHKAEPMKALEYRIDARLDENLRLSGTTRVKIQVAGQPMRALPFLISARMKATGATVDGQPAEIFTRESLRESAIRGGHDELFLIVPAAPVAAGVPHEVEIRHEGDVIVPAGNGIYYVGSRGTWYPHQAAEFARFEMTFRHPRALTLVATGNMVEEKTEGDVRMVRYATEAPIRFAGFNLGDYRKVSVSKAGYTIEVYGNRTSEPGLARRAPMPAIPGAVTGRRPPAGGLDLPVALTLPPDPSVHLRELAGSLEGAMEFMTSQFGAMPLKTVTVSPIPGFFGQGFPGLVYLSTFAYLSPEQRATKDRTQQTFFTDLLPAHELAHQWWGNLITAEAYQDEWLMEALANYSALMYMEKRRGARALEQVLDDFRAHLLAKTENGQTTESTGPIMWGVRLRSGGDEVWRVITYEKGAWILHMLRTQMGDEQFRRMLRELVRRYAYKSLTTDEFRRAAAGFLPPGSPDPTLENFFESWVYGTGIPSLKLNYSVKGKAPAFRVTGTLTQSDVDNEFSADVPVEIQTAKGAAAVKWVRTSDEEVAFTVNLKQRPARVVIPPAAILTGKR